jgi:hypothetical protein
LKQRNADREHATDGHIHPKKPFAPVARKNLKVAERALGFQVPKLLRAIYETVGNGGFGPEYGIVGTKGGFKLDGCTLESCYQDMVKLDKENASGGGQSVCFRWPITDAACGPV